MNSSMADYLKVVTPYLHPELVSPLALSSIQALARNLPPFSHAGFECRLGADQLRVDFQVNFHRLASSLPKDFLTHSTWRAFHDFYQEWIEPTSFLQQNVDNLWLEFDLNEPLSQVPIPCIFLTLNQKIACETQELMETALKLLNHSDFSILKSNLRLCADSLPDSAKITHVGIMQSRPDQGVRLNVKGIPPQQLLNYLLQIGWKDSTKTLSNLVSTLSELVDEIVLTFDIGETIHPRIGLECFLEKQPHTEPRWQLFLDYLVERGLCTPAKQNALLVWPGFSQKADQPNVWPQNLSWGARFLGSQTLSVFWRTISLIKIIYQPGNPLETKGYLAFAHRWLDVSAFTSQEQQKTEDCNKTRWLKREETETEVSQYLEQVRHYYDRMNPVILKDVGKTYQSGLLMTDSQADPYRETNLYCAAQAGINPGYHVLDAGCGVCGPSIDIAQHIEGVRIDAITLSPAQANTARELVQQAGLADQIQIHVGDFHYLPFANEVFDVVFFFESTGYSYDHQRLFTEVYRVLRPGGSLYIKEPFTKESPLSDQEQQELAEFNKIYVYKTALISKAVQVISAVGFKNVTSRDLSEFSAHKKFTRRCLSPKMDFHA
jgi:ubiquinone/menaquinone biosynthesis C-methylase UbiE